VNENTHASERAAWPQIGDIIPNHDGGQPTPSRALDGLSTVIQDDGYTSLAFDGRHLRWQENEINMEFEYQAFAIAGNMFFVDAMPLTTDRCCLNVILDLGKMNALIVETRFPTPERAQSGVLDRLARTGSQSAVSVRYRQGGIDTTLTKPFDVSRALIGKHLRYTYSATHVYDHFYHSDKYYSWFCRLGPDQGLGDFEECDVFDLEPDLYLVAWREKLLPCVGIMVENHSSMRSLGKICGADAYSGGISNTRVGASIRLIADSAHA